MINRQLLMHPENIKSDSTAIHMKIKKTIKDISTAIRELVIPIVANYNKTCYSRRESALEKDCGEDSHVELSACKSSI